MRGYQNGEKLVNFWHTWSRYNCNVISKINIISNISTPINSDAIVNSGTTKHF